MFTDIRTLGFTLTDALQSHVESRIAAALGWAGDAIGRVTVRLDDVNAGRGGIDKRCRIVAELRRRQTVVTADVVSSDLYAAIDEAASRARQVVRRRLTRHLARERRNPQRPGTLVTAGGG